MRGPRAAALLLVGVLVLAACSDDTDGQGSATTSTVANSSTSDPATTEPPTTAPPTTVAFATTTSSSSTTTSTTSTTSTTVAPTAPSTSAETTTVAAAPVCVVEVEPGDTLDAIAAATGDPTVDVGSLQAENAIPDPDSINAGTVLDVCVGNGIDDTTGAPRVPPATDPASDPTTAATPPPTLPTPPEGLPSGIQAQQQKLNELFAGYGLGALTVDGQSGRLTRQQLCAARAALNLPISRDDMAPGSPEEQALMSAAALPVPPSAATGAGRWAIIDQTCQIMFVGDGNSIVFVFGTSTGMPDYPTRNQRASRAFRFDPAIANGGWHDSIDFPAAGDNPLNGNMYKPIYFDDGQAIHGANNVPTDPKSHGCARLRVTDQDALVGWLGLADARGQVWDKGQIGLTVTVQGQY